MEVRLAHNPGSLGRVAQKLGEAAFFNQNEHPVLRATPTAHIRPNVGTRFLLARFRLGMPRLASMLKGWSPSTERIVFRPNLGWYLAYSALPVPGCLGIFLALTTRDLTLTLTGIVSTSVVIAMFEVFALAYLLGVRIEVDNVSVSKVYFYGLLRRRIPREQLRASSHTERGGGWSYERVDFASSDDKVSGFSVHPFWVWRSGDVELLRTIAAEGK